MQYVLGHSNLEMKLKKWIPQPWHIYPTEGSSLFIFGHRSYFRLRCYKLIQHPYMFMIWILVVILNTVLTAAFQPEYNYGEPTSTILMSFQIILLVFFWIRSIIEIIAVGLILHPNSFLRKFWNIIEIIVNILGIIELLPFTKNYRWLRAFAVIRPIRFFTRIPGFLPIILPLVRESLIIGETILYYIAILASFAIIGVIILGDGIKQRCHITSVNPESSYNYIKLPFLLRNVTKICGKGFHCPSIEGTIVECLPMKLSEGSKFMTYNNIGSAMLILFKVSTVDNWYENMEDIMNINGGASVLLLVFIIFISFSFFCILLAIIHESYTYTTTNLSLIKSKLVNNEEIMMSNKVFKKDATVQAPEEEEFILLLPPNIRRRTTNVLNPSFSSSTLYDSFDMMQERMRTSHMNQFVSYPGVPPITSFLKAYKIKGILNALCDQERSLYGPIFSGNFSYSIIKIIDNNFFCIFIICISLINTILLAIPWEGMDSVLRERLMIASSSCSLFYFIPFILKCFSFGPIATIRDIWNIFDILSAITGLLELAIPKIFNYHFIRGLRSLRVLRLGKYVPLLREFKYYYISDFTYTAILIFITLILYAILGMQIFGDSYHLKGWLRGSFGNFWNSLLLCFIVFTGINWTECMFGALDTGNPVTGIIYFLSLYIIVILQYNFFISIMINRFESIISAHERSDRIEVPPLLVLPPYDPSKIEQTNSMELTIGEKIQNKFFDEYYKNKSSSLSKYERFFAWLLSSRTLSVKGVSFFLIEPQCYIRQKFLYILGSVWYRFLVIFCIIGGNIAMIFEKYDNSEHLKNTLWGIHVGFTFFFICEMAIKFVAFGIIFPCSESDPTVLNPHCVAYFGDPLNWIDFIANSLSFTGIYVEPCRAGKSIQLIRLITSSEYPNVIFLATLEQLKHLWSALLLIFYVLLFFTIAGMQFFSGRLHHCSDLNIKERYACNGNFNVSIVGYVEEEIFVYKRIWVKEKFTYDNFGSALLSVFTTAIGSNWTSLMYDSMDSVNDNTALSYNNSAYYVIYFIFCIIIVRFIAFRTIIAVIAAYLSRIYIKFDGRTELRSDQERYLKAKFIVWSTSMKDVSKPKNNFLSFIAHRILTNQNPKFTHTYFYYFINGFIFLNCIFLTSITSDEPKWKQDMIFAIDIFGIFICSLEIILRIIAYGPWKFFFSVWNIIDFIILLLIIIAAIIPVVSFMRVFRVIKLIKGSKIEILFFTIFQNKRWLINAFVCFCILVLCYAFLGTPIFGNIKYYDIGITENRNFKTTIVSILMMFQVGTMNGWEHIMLACAQNPLFTGCIIGSKIEGCGSIVSSLVFFISYIIIALLILLLFTSLFLNIFTTRLQDKTTEAFFQFKKLWLETIGSGEILINFNDFISIIPYLPLSLTGLKENYKNNRLDILKFLLILRLPLDSKYRICYNDIILGLTYKIFRIKLSSEFNFNFSFNENREYFTASHAYAAIIIQRYWRQKRLALEKKRLAMLDLVHEESKLKHQLSEFTNIDFINSTQINREISEVITSVEPLRLNVISHLPRGALAAPGTPLFMFDFLDSICPRIPSSLSHVNPELNKYKNE